jgi:hypothetical protein
MQPFLKDLLPSFYHAPKYRTATQCAATVSENESFYKQRQRDRELLHALTCPTIAGLKRAIKMNSIQNCPVTVEDINLAEAIYGLDVPSLDVPSLKGKLTRGFPSPVVQDYIEIPPELLFLQQQIEKTYSGPKSNSTIN